MINSMDLLAKLLANENISVVRAPVKTASFDINSRNLTLPQWKDMSPAVEEMLVGHEVGHALYTTSEYMTVAPNISRTLHSYMNVIEDVRIEKKVKNKYPGLRNSFMKGYKELNEKDFFGIRDRKDLSNLLLIDRINLYYKVGFNCGVKFTKEEAAFLPRVDKCDSILDVYNLAVEMFEFSKKAKEDRERLIDLDDLLASDDEDEDNDADEMFADDSDPSDPEDGESEDGEESETSPTYEPSYGSPPMNNEEDLESITDKMLRQRLAESADQSYTVIGVPPKLIANTDILVGYKTVLFELEQQFDNYTKTDKYMQMQFSSESYKKMEEKFKRESSRVVNYLVKEFEMKKSASNYKRSQISKSGELDVRKLYAYKLNDDIFKRITVVPDGKNHGMLFLLDWSGSMAPVIDDTIKQVINLSMFCYRAQIPFQVFAFSDSYPTAESHRMPKDKTGMTGLLADHLHMIEFFSSKMSNSEMTRMCNILLKRPYQWSREYSLGSTPLNEGLLFMADYIGEWKQKNNVEKVSFITLTDGEGHAVNAFMNNTDFRRHGMTGRAKFVVRDPMTRREYNLPQYGSDQSRVFLKVIKDRYDVTTIGFHVLAVNKRDLHNFVRANVDTNGIYSSEYVIMDNMRKQFREKDFAVVNNTGRDEMYVLPAHKLKTEDKDLTVDKKMTASQLAREFTKFLDSKVTSRILLNRFIKMVA